mmetsp:Transcript_832/g.3051  ORF Transcript_832/g.3051 Transcript_832/m.3051 type:complete len:250 (+) Transcript_832:1217-1966(+)
MRLPLSCESLATRATISCRVAALSVTGFPVSLTSAMDGKSFRASTLSQSSIALSASRSALSRSKGTGPLGFATCMRGYLTRLSLLPPRCSRSSDGSNASFSTSDHSSTSLRSRLSASRPASAARSPISSPSPSPRREMPQSARLSSLRDGQAPKIAVASRHDAPDLFITRMERFGNGDGPGGGIDGHAALTPVMSRTRSAGNSGPNAATASQSLIRLPARSRIPTFAAGKPHDAASPGSPAVWMAASGR